MNRIFTYILVVYIFSLLPLFLTSEDVYVNTNLTFPFFYAPIFIIISIFCFILGNLIGKVIFKKGKQVLIEYSIGSFNIWLSYFLCTLGVIVSYSYVTSSDTSLLDYFIKVILTESSGLYEGGNKRILINGDDGGLPGVIKMFNIMPITIYLLTFYLLNFAATSDYRKLKILNRFALICSILRTFLLLDRLAFLPILICNFFLIIDKKTLFKKSNILFLTMVIGALNIVTQQRGYSNIFEGFLNYMHSHLLNLEILIRTFESHNYWGKNSLFVAFYYSIYYDFFNGSIQLDIYKYGDNNAQNYISFSYMDFGYFTVFIFLLLGIIVYWLDTKFLHSSNIWVKVTYFGLLTNFISFIIVPSHTGIEFWLSILFLLYFSCFIYKGQRKNKSPSIG